MFSFHIVNTLLLFGLVVPNLLDNLNMHRHCLDIFQLDKHCILMRQVNLAVVHWRTLGKVLHDSHPLTLSRSHIRDNQCGQPCRMCLANMGHMMLLLLYLDVGLHPDCSHTRVQVCNITTKKRVHTTKHDAHDLVCMCAYSTRNTH